MYTIPLEGEEISQAILLNVILAMYCTAAAAPAVANRGERPPAAGDDQVQIAFVFDYRHPLLVVIGIDVDLQCTLTPPVAAAFEIADFALRHLDQLAMYVRARESRARADRRLLRAHRDDHVRAYMHVPRTHRRH